MLGTAGGASANQTQNLSGRARFPNYPQNRVVFVVDDDEIAVYSGFYELPSRIDEFLDLLFRHQRNFIIFLFTITLLAVFLCWRAYEYRDNGVTTVRRSYKFKF